MCRMNKRIPKVKLFPGEMDTRKKGKNSGHSSGIYFFCCHTSGDYQIKDKRRNSKM